MFTVAAPGMGQSPTAPPSRWQHLADPVFQHLGPDQGLPNQIVTAIEEDGDGFLWFGSQGGLGRWDGYRFKSYKPDPKDAHALPDPWVRCLHTDRKGQLWIGTNSNGLARYDRDEDRFLRVGTGPGRLSDGAVYAIAEDAKGRLWIGTGSGIDLLDPQTGGITQFRQDAQDPESLADDHIRALLFDHSGRLWVGTRDGLARLDAGSKGFIRVPLPGAKGAIEVSSLFEDSAGRLFIGTRYKGTYVLASGAEEPVLVVDQAEATREPHLVSAMVELAPGRIWLGTFGEGIEAIDTVGGQPNWLRHDAARPSSLAHNDIWSLYRDRAGSIWVGSTAGLSRFDPQDSAIVELFGGTGRTDGLSQADVRSVLVATDGRLWLGTSPTGVDILDPMGARVVALRSDADNPEHALPSGSVGALVQAPDGTVFIGTEEGLYRSSADGRRVTRVVVADKAPEMTIFALAIGDGALWVGSFGDGLWRYDLVTRRAVRHWGKDELSGQFVNSIAPAGMGRLWVGTDNGLSRLDIETGRMEKIQADPQDMQTNAALTVSTPLTDGQGRLWVGTFGSGIVILNQRDAAGQPHIRRIGLAEGLPNENVNKLLADKSGQVWASTDDGLAVIDPATLSVRALRRAQGLAIPSYWVGSGASTPEGELLFGGLGGLTIVRPERVQSWNYRPPVVITDLRVGGHRKAGFEGAGKLPTAVVSPDANSFAVEFAALDFSAPERNLYAYRLEGFDKDWIATEAGRRLAAYTNLPPGDYTLRVKGSNRDGVWTETELALPIRVLPAWYQTLWFKLLVGLAAVLAVAGIIRWRTAHLRRRQRALEQAIIERTEQLAASVQKADTLLENMLPRHVIEALSTNGRFEPSRHEEASVLFTDLVGFTQATATMPASRMVGELNDIFAAFDDIAVEEGIEKIKTIGDAYMAAAGLADGQPDHAVRCVRAALRMQDFVRLRNSDNPFKWALRVGIHSGPVISGVVGKRKYAFDIWGDAVNLSSRMESAGEPEKVNVSAYTYALIRDEFNCSYRGKQAAKGKGEVDMYFVDGLRQTES